MAPIRPQLLVSHANHSATETSMYECVCVCVCVVVVVVVVVVARLSSLETQQNTKHFRNY